MTTITFLGGYTKMVQVSIYIKNFGFCTINHSLAVMGLELRIQGGAAAFFPLFKITER